MYQFPFINTLLKFAELRRGGEEKGMEKKPIKSAGSLPLQHQRELRPDWVLTPPNQPLLCVCADIGHWASPSGSQIQRG